MELSNKVGSKKTLAEVKNIGCISKTILVENVTPQSHRIKNSNKNVTSNKTKHVLAKNELNELAENFKSISTKRLTKDFIKKNLVFSMEQKIFLQEYFTII